MLPTTVYLQWNAPRAGVILQLGQIKMRIASRTIRPRIHPHVNQTRQIRVGLPNRHSRTQPTNPVIRKSSQRLLHRIERQRHQQVEVVVHYLESARHHTRNHPRLGIHLDRPPNHARVTAESSLPVAIAQHHPLSPAWLLVRRRRPLSNRGRHIQRLQNAARNQRRIHLLRLSGARNACCSRLPGAQRLEAVVMPRKGQVHRGRQPQIITKVGQPRRAWSVQTQSNQLLRLRVGQRPNQYAVEHTEHCRIRPDANGQRENHGNREPRRSFQPAKGKLDVRQNRFECGPLPRLAAPFLNDQSHCQTPGVPSAQPVHAAFPRRLIPRLSPRCAPGSKRRDRHNGGDG